MPELNIQLVHRKQIDALRWDETIAASPDGRVYAASWFLDIMAPGWQALVVGNYEFVMPLPVRSKFGIDYVYQPAFCQQLGIFGLQRAGQVITDSFLTVLQKHFKYAEVNAHSGQLQSNFGFVERKNYLLDLNHSFAVLQLQFSRSARRNIAKAKEQQIHVFASANANELIDLHRQRYGNKLATETDLLALKLLFDYAVKTGRGYCFYAKDKGGNTVASSGYIQFNNRLTFLVNGNLEKGLASGATHLLKSFAICRFAEQALLMDFEGSDTASFARFYEQYGATACDNYPFFVFDNLHWSVKLLRAGLQLIRGLTDS